jgi:LmbE family N-acetylglucosaminyl deacetylase
MPRAVAISPHLDDAAFSCGGVLARLARTGWEVVVCTAFTLSVTAPRGFALACQTDKGLGPEVDYMALRRAEDAAACAALGATPLWLPFAEAPHRGYHDARALFAAPLPADDVAAGLGRALAEGPLAAMPDLLLAPQAIGGHVDHVRVVEALSPLLHADTPCLWWTDWPYAARPGSHPARPFGARFDALPERVLRGDAEARRTACASYASQLPFQFGGMAGLDGMLAAAGPAEPFRIEGACPAELLN